MNHVQYIFPFLDIPSRHYIIPALKRCVKLIVNFLPIYILLRVLFQYFKIWLISHDSVMTQSFENGGVDSACFFTESTQLLTLTPTAGITRNEYFSCFGIGLVIDGKTTNYTRICQYNMGCDQRKYTVGLLIIY